MRILPKCRSEKAREGKHKFGGTTKKRLRKLVGWEFCQNEGCHFMVKRKAYEKVKAKHG